MLGRAALVRHALTISLPTITLLALPAIAPITPALTFALQVSTAIAAYLAVFMLTHELAHGALGLSRRRNDFALAVAGTCIATSGHALRLMHLRHHARPLATDDLEGIPARLSPSRALLAAPVLSGRLIAAAWRTATARDRAWQRHEHAAVALLAILAALGPRTLQIYMATAVALQALAPFWAGHMPHRTPPWLRTVAYPLTRLGSTLAATLLLHDEHHRHPKVPIRQLVNTKLRRATRPTDEPVLTTLKTLLTRSGTLGRLRSSLRCLQQGRVEPHRATMPVARALFAPPAHRAPPATATES